ncbi:MAG TPA: YihY/virulence factor BrkB family protein [Nitrococcus sp.]|nr:YihY/virulence factor BrkB family protein [Nitrococcus sp.]
MSEKARRIPIMLRRILHFSRRVLAGFLKNHGILLAGGVGYNVLLSIVPLFAVFAAVLSRVVDESQLVSTIHAQAQLLAPGHAELLVNAVEQLIHNQGLVGGIGFLVLLFFSSLAFRMLEDAIAIIFHRHAPALTRRFWVSALLPYVYVLVLGIGVLALTLLVATVNRISGGNPSISGVGLTLSWEAATVLYGFGFIGIGLLFTSIYKVLPVVRIALRRALVGGFTAAVLWELSLWVLVYYFDNISLVNVVYGSFATLVVVLLSFEVGAIILLLGAQVIAELEYSAAAGLTWHEDAAKPDSELGNPQKNCSPPPPERRVPIAK